MKANNPIRIVMSASLLPLGILVLTSCGRRTPEQTKEQCVRNMERVWSTAASYALEHKMSGDALCAPRLMPDYFKEGRPPKCPLGDTDYAPFTLIAGPRCPHRPDVHTGVRMPDDAKWGLPK